MNYITAANFKKLLDAGWAITVFKDADGRYVAALQIETGDIEEYVAQVDPMLTDVSNDPSDALANVIDSNVDVAFCNN